jgi:DNA repair exonuclease SbcCD ATPase subunit
MTKPYVTSVQSTLKKGVNVELGQRTVIVGGNGAGKTSVVQSIQLATNGYVQDAEGREKIATNAAISRLFPAVDDMHINLTWSDGEKTTWTMKKANRGFKTPTSEGRTNVSFPVADLKVELVKKDASVKEWIDRNVMFDVSEDDLLKAVQKQEQPLLKNLIRTTRSHEFFVLAKAAGDQAASAKRDATTREKSVERLAQDLKPPLTDSERVRLSKRKAAIDAELIGKVSASEYEEEKEHLAALKRNLLSAKEHLTEMEAAIAEEVNTEKVNRLRTVLRLIDDHRSNFGTETCYVCATKNVDIAERRERVFAAFRAESSKATKGHTVDEVELAKQRWEQSKEKFNVKLTAFKQKEVADPELEAERAEIEDALRTTQALDKLWHNYNSEKMEIEQLQEKAAKLTKISKHLSEYGAHQLKARKAALEERVTKFLPGDTFAVDFDNALIGFKRGDQLHASLSGAEWSRMLLALGAALQTDSTPTILAPDDRAWDRDTLTSVMEALADVDAQVLIMSTVEPDEVEGWNIVHLG